MATRITMRCQDHGTEKDFFFDGTPPDLHRDTHGTTCQVPELDRDRYEPCTFKRIWQTPNIGAVKGAGGSPARSAK